LNDFFRHGVFATKSDEPSALHGRPTFFKSRLEIMNEITNKNSTKETKDIPSADLLLFRITVAAVPSVSKPTNSPLFL
jgi:hypothetical protein